VKELRFTTTVMEVPPSPLGLLPAKVLVHHRCQECHELVRTDELVDHARAHDSRLSAEEQQSTSA
jgi:hypothetical protein